MTRFALYSQKDEAPPKGGLWPPLRILAWAALWAAMFFWAWTFFSTRI